MARELWSKLLRQGERATARSISSMRSSATDRLWRLGLWVAYRVVSVGWYVFRPQTRGVFIAVWHNRELLLIRNSYRQWYALPAAECGVAKHLHTPRCESFEKKLELWLSRKPCILRATSRRRSNSSVIDALFSK